jgi:hypothetical protein
MKQLRDAVKEVRDKFREGIWETNKQLDQVLAALVQNKK